MKLSCNHALQTRKFIFALDELISPIVANGTKLKIGCALATIDYPSSNDFWISQIQYFFKQHQYIRDSWGYDLSLEWESHDWITSKDWSMNAITKCIFIRHTDFSSEMEINIEAIFEFNDELQAIETLLLIDEDVKGALKRVE